MSPERGTSAASCACSMTIEALGAAQNSERDAFTVVDETVGWARLLRVQGEVRELADFAGEDPLQGAADRYLADRGAGIQGRAHSRPDTLGNPPLAGPQSFRQARYPRRRPLAHSKGLETADFRAGPAKPAALRNR